MIDVHTHVPTHRDAVPPEELVVNDKWRPDRPVAATTTWFEYDAAFAGIEVSVAFSIARDRERVVTSLNDDCAAFVAAAPERRIGFLSVHPGVEGWEDELERATGDLGLKGIKLGPNYQIFDPLGDAALRLYGLAERRGLPILFHQGASPVREAPLRYAHPLLMDEIAIRFPELRVVMAHMGHPWWRETIVTIRKHPHVYADVSALFYRPWSLYEGMRLVTEWNVFEKLLFGSDYPIATPAETAAGLRRVNDAIAGTGLPPVPLDPIEAIIERDSLPLLGLERPGRGS
jgi:predicted TIM-barrel fold metal-dependent hydrolase